MPASPSFSDGSRHRPSYCRGPTRRRRRCHHPRFVRPLPNHCPSFHPTRSSRTADPPTAAPAPANRASASAACPGHCSSFHFGDLVGDDGLLRLASSRHRGLHVLLRTGVGDLCEVRRKGSPWHVLPRASKARCPEPAAGDEEVGLLVHQILEDVPRLDESVKEVEIHRARRVAQDEGPGVEDPLEGGALHGAPDRLAMKS